jgi:DNA ligase D
MEWNRDPKPATSVSPTADAEYGRVMAKANEHGEPVELTAAGRPVEISSPQKLMFPEPGITKLDLARYYLAVEESIMRTVRNRPTLLQRFPNGVTGSNFFQKRIPDSAPEWLQTTIVSTPNGTTSRAIVMADIAHVLWAANLGCLGFHPWPYRADDPDNTDELRIDLDPSPGVTFAMVQEAAVEVRRLLDDNGIASFIKTTGNRGLHVYVHVEPGWDSFGTRQAAVSVARALAAARPDLITDKWWKEERGARVFIDFNQNAPHKTVFGAWCVRSRPGAQVSTPFAWAELPAIHPDDLTVLSVPPRLATAGDPWAGIEATTQSIAPLVGRYERDLANGIPDAPWPPVYPKMPDEARRVNPSRARHDTDETTMGDSNKITKP